MVLVHPEYAMLVLEINDLQEQIAKLIVERDMLMCYTCSDIQVDYMLKIGALEYKFMVAGNCYRKNLRKLELIDEKIKKKLPVNLSAINRKINAEFKKSSKIESDLSHQIDLAIEMSSMDSFEYEFMDEMNLDYFKLQKMYNPIFDTELSDERDKFYAKIEKYYEKGNYKKIHKLAEDYDKDFVFQDEIVTMKLLIKNYKVLLEKLQKQLAKIKNSFPYNQKIILEDENLCRRKKDSLNREILQVHAENKKLEKKIENKLKKL